MYNTTKQTLHTVVTLKQKGQKIIQYFDVLDCWKKYFPLKIETLNKANYTMHQQLFTKLNHTTSFHKYLAKSCIYFAEAIISLFCQKNRKRNISYNEMRQIHSKRTNFSWQLNETFLCNLHYQIILYLSNIILLNIKKLV